VCLVYLLEPGIWSAILTTSILHEYPLARFAARYWRIHYQITDNPGTQLNRVVNQLFQNRLGAFHNWLRLHDPDDPYNTEVDFERNRDPSSIPSPLYYASFLGLDV